MSQDGKPLNFIEQIIEEDVSGGMPKSLLRFRFPPEPNGYLHIGHAKAIGISFGLGESYHAPVNLRFDDTNPIAEEQEYVDAIKQDIAWLGYKWDQELYASDYFQELYEWAVLLIRHGKAYIDSQTSEEIAAQKGTPTEPGVNSPYRDRSVDENLDLFERMKNGEFKRGEHVLRAKIDMSDPNMLMRDPIMYRVMFEHHHRTGDQWCIYPMYDWAHGQCDYIEQITHSLCSLEFKPHRKLYNWFLENLHPHLKEHYPIPPKQREFSRLNLSYTVMSKRILKELVDEGIVDGWDDPRMPTLAGLRRRGYTPAAIRKFTETAGVTKRDNVIDLALLEWSIREDLNRTARRVMAVLNPVKVVITNYPAGQEEMLVADYMTEEGDHGEREVPFSGEIYIEREDFKEEANRKFFRLTLGREVRLKNAYIIKGNEVVRDDDGNITEIRCTYDPMSRSGSGTEESQRKVKGTLHWVSVQHAILATVNIYDRLFSHEEPAGQKDVDFKSFLNPESLKTVEAWLEPSLAGAQAGDRYQFQRLGYFAVDQCSSPDHLVFNKTVGLRDTYAKKTN
jgi:glutaminyl-tRNA synthetase